MSTLQVANIHLESTANNRIQYMGDDTAAFYVGGNEAMRLYWDPLTPESKIGIGTTNPEHKLHVKQDAGPVGTVAIVADDPNLAAINSITGASGEAYVAVSAPTERGGVMARGSGTTPVFYSAAGLDMDFEPGNSGTPAMRLTTAGRLGIGTTTPTDQVQLVGGNILIGTDSGSAFNSQARLRIQGAGAEYIQIKGDGTGAVGLLFGDTTDSYTAGVLSNQPDNDLRLVAGNATQFLIGAAGQLGIGGATYGTAGQVLTSGGSGAAPSWTTLSSAAPTTAQVGTATAGLAVGDVGSYALLWHNTTAAETPGTTVAGSTLRYGSTFTDATNPLVGYGPTAPAGTWRCMGHTAVQGGSTAYAFTIANVTVWLRIS